jgi:uncharacterized membrane protein
MPLDALPLSSPPARLDRLAASRPLRGLLAGSMVTVGVLHFVHPDFFMKIMPDYIPADKHRFLVLLSGFFEIAGGVGLLLPQTRRAAAFGLVALYIAVFPANIYLDRSHVEVSLYPAKRTHP